MWSSFFWARRKSVNLVTPLSDPAEIAVTFLALLIGSIVLATVGFGIGLTASPILLFVHDPQTVVVVLNTSSAILLSLVARQTRHQLRVREIGPMALAGAVGVPVGVFMLISLSDTMLRAGIAGLVLVLSLMVARDIRLPESVPNFVGPAVGLIVGALVTGLAIGAPLVVLLLMGRGAPGTLVRASTGFYYLVVSAVAVIVYALAGLFTADRIILILMISPAIIVGFCLASIIVRRLNEQLFRRVVLALVMVTSLTVLGRELFDLQG